MLTSLTLALAGPAFAQGTEAPLRKSGLFGTTRVDAGNRDSFNLLFAPSEAFESALPPDARFKVSRGGLDSGGYSSMLTTSADYTRTRRRTQLGATLLTSFKYYPRLDRVEPVSHSAGLGFTVRLPKQSSLQANSTAAYAPAYLYQLFPKAPLAAPVEAIAADPDYRIDTSDSYTYGTNLALTVGRTRGTRITATADYRHTDFHREIVTRPNLTTSGAGMKLSRGVTRNSGLSVEYQYRTGTYGLTGVSNEHRLALGADYSYALSATRRAAFHVNVAPALLELPESVVRANLPIGVGAPIDAGAISNPDPRLYRLEGDARVDLDVGRSWRATATYRRSVEYLAVLTEPVFSDAARVELNGLITRRIDVAAGGGYALGRSALNHNSQSLRTDTGQLRLRYALTRTLAVYSQYVYYYYDMHEQSYLAPNLPRTFEQHEVRVGFMLFVRPFGDTGKGRTR